MKTWFDLFIDWIDQFTCMECHQVFATAAERRLHEAQKGLIEL